jgi:hypothetical protein
LRRPAFAIFSEILPPECKSADSVEIVMAVKGSTGQMMDATVV